MWVGYLESIGIKSVVSPRHEGAFYWDIADSHGNMYEVKYDAKAMYWAKRRGTPPNMYVEFWNTKKDIPSGISLSRCLFFVYIIKTDDGHTAFKFNLRRLYFHLINGGYESRGNKSYGDNNARGWTPQIDKLISSPDSGFIAKIEL